MKLSHYAFVYPCRDREGNYLLYSAKTGASVLVPEHLLQDIERGHLAPADERTLTELGFLVSDHESEKLEIGGIVSEINRREQIYSATVVLNLDCNLACTYCFEGTIKGKRFMDEDTADRLVETLINDPIARGKPVALNFYGGEPLLSVPVIKFIAGRIKASSAERDLPFSFNLRTNGTLLTRQVVKELLPYGLKGATVPLDGPREIHDLARPFTSGKGSFDIIIRNLKDVAGMISLQLGGNFTKENFRQFPRLFDFLIEEGITPDLVGEVQFCPVYKTTSSRALPEFTHGCTSAKEPWVAEAILFLREELLRRGYNPPKMATHVCAVEIHDNLVINFDGTFYKCPAFIGIKGLEAGNVKAGMHDCSASHGIGMWRNEECIDCAYLPLCFGGCRYLSFLQDGRIDVVNCNRDFFDAYLESSIKQDIFYRSRLKPR